MDDVKQQEIATTAIRQPHRWKKGESGNPNGRPSNAEIDLLRKAIEEGEKKYGKDLFQHAVERAFRNDTVLIAILKKLVPDMIKGEGFSNEPTRVIIVRPPKGYKYTSNRVKE